MNSNNPVQSSTLLFQKIEDICTITRGRVMSKDYIQENAGDYPVYSSQTENNGELGRIKTYDFEGEYLTWTTDGANAGSIFYRNGKFSITNVCGLLKLKRDNISIRYLMYALQIEAPKYVSKGMGNPKLMSNVMARIKVPIPSIEQQEKIVRVLDTFQNLKISLNQELELREKQYQYYSRKLLFMDKDTEFVKIGDCCKVEKGKTPIQKAIPGEYPLVATTEERQSCDNFQFDAEAVCVPLISSRGHGVASISRIYYQEGKFALGNILCAIIPNDKNYLNAKFLRYYLYLKKDVLLVPLMRGGANVSLTVDSIKGVQIPVIPIDRQKEIVDILEKFDCLCNDQEVGIPAEIRLREKQYMFYSNCMFNFE